MKAHSIYLGKKGKGRTVRTKFPDEFIEELFVNRASVKVDLNGAIQNLTYCFPPEQGILDYRYYRIPGKALVVSPAISCPSEENNSPAICFPENIPLDILNGIYQTAQGYGVCKEYVPEVDWTNEDGWIKSVLGRFGGKDSIESKRYTQMVACHSDLNLQLSHRLGNSKKIMWGIYRVYSLSEERIGGLVLEDEKRILEDASKASYDKYQRDLFQ